MHLISTIHQVHQRCHSLFHLGIIQAANVKEKVFKSFCAHAGALTHSTIGIAQNTPLSMRYSDFAVHRLRPIFLEQVHFLSRYIAKLSAIVAGPNRNVGNHILHSLAFICGILFHLFLAAIHQQSSLQATVFQGKERYAAGLISLFHQSLSQINTIIGNFQKDFFTLL